MRPLTALTFISIAVPTAGRAIQGSFWSTAATSLHPTLQLRELQLNNTESAAASTINDDTDPDEAASPDPDDDDSDQGLTPEELENIWCKAKSRGVKLIKAMMMNDQESQTLLSWPYIQSPWDGNLKPELRKWGYRDDDELHEQNDDQCDFDKTQEVGDAFKALNVDPRSKGQGGPNQCFYLEHMNGPTVIRDENGELPFEEEQHYKADGKDYRVTQAYAKIGVNPVDGFVYFISRQSPEHAASEYWHHEPSTDELPALRASSDLAWGMWNRAASGNLRKLNYFMAVQIINDETQYIIKRAISQYNIADLPGWPGVDFQFAVETGKELEMEAAMALLGSPNGIGAGYFIIQHRKQLDWRYIWKVKIWTSGTGEWALPNMLFYVSDHAPFEGPEPQRRLEEQLESLHLTQRRKRNLSKAHKPGAKPGVVYRNKDGKRLNRERILKAKL